GSRSRLQSDDDPEISPLGGPDACREVASDVARRAPSWWHRSETRLGRTRPRAPSPRPIGEAIGRNPPPRWGGLPERRPHTMRPRQFWFVTRLLWNCSIRPVAYVVTSILLLMVR